MPLLGCYSGTLLNTVGWRSIPRQDTPAQDPVFWKPVGEGGSAGLVLGKPGCCPVYSNLQQAIWVGGAPKARLQELPGLSMVVVESGAGTGLSDAPFPSPGLVAVLERDPPTADPPPITLLGPIPDFNSPGKGSSLVGSPIWFHRASLP